jgi:CheY-like chemotaxis protein
MRSTYHLLYVEDDEAEIATFRRLYEGDLFEVTPVCIQFPRSALPQIDAALATRVPDLFVLDLFFPVTSTPPGGFTGDTVDEARAQLRRVLQVAGELEGAFFDEPGLARSEKELLRAGSDLVYWSQRMLRHWCDVLGQSPDGGIALMRLIHEKYPSVPVVFYSRKAMVADLKAALQAGALDVIQKPHRSLEDAEAVRIREVLAACCARQPPGWRRPPALGSKA